MLLVPMLLFIASWLVSQWARGRYQNMLSENLRINAPGGATGGQMALEFLKDQGVTDVQVVIHNAMVSDYFDPSRRRLFLRKDVAEGTSLAAWAIAMHEAAHALQTGEQMDALKWRQTTIRLTRYMPIFVLLAAGLMMAFMKVPFRLALMFGAAGIALLMAMNAGSIGVEKQANAKLRAWLETRFARQPSLLEKLDELIGPVATRDLGDLVLAPRYFFFSALPGSGSARPK
jgi:uncharacterized protein